MPTIVAYVRVSTLAQVEEGISLEAQAARARKWCADHGHAKPHIEADEGLSGKRADNRPALQRALDAVCASRGVLIVYSLSRLCRSTRDALDIAERLKKAGANLVSLTEAIDTQTAMGSFFFTVMAALGELERRLIGDRTREALAHKKRNGEKCGGDTPYGFTLANRRLVEHDQEQAVIARILRDCDGGKLYKATAIALNSEGVKSRRGGKWSAKTVRDIYRRA